MSLHRTKHLPKELRLMTWRHRARFAIIMLLTLTLGANAGIMTVDAMAGQLDLILAITTPLIVFMLAYTSYNYLDDESVLVKATAIKIDELKEGREQEIYKAINKAIAERMGKLSSEAAEVLHNAMRDLAHELAEDGATPESLEVKAETLRVDNEPPKTKQAKKPAAKKPATKKTPAKKTTAKKTSKTTRSRV